tara:strand:+ start:526 stop:1494 length:969 start_codon:yes stop_codon:yes gene_type:complete
MAIFRGGKRVGPFDVRVGFPRDKSMDNIDSDPRLRQYANSENTIGRFRAAMAAAEGYARPARFAVRIFPPTNLESIVKSAQNTDTRAGGNFEQANAGTPQKPDGKFMNDLSQSLGRQINIHCDSVSMPGHDLQAQTVQYGSAPARDIVTSHAFAGNISASFYADKYLRERHFFELWQKMAVNMVTHKANYYDDYVGKMHIYQLGSMDGESNRDVPTYGIEAVEVYPATISAVEYNYASSNQLVKINVAFAYKQWHNLATDSISGIDFASSRQTLPDIKERDTGLFGKLPPDLRRAGRDIFNTAKNQVPIGKLFKGKLFPPFT